MRVAKAAGVDVAKYEAAISGDAEAPVLPSSITQPACRSDPESMSKLTEFAFDVTLAAAVLHGSLGGRTESTPSLCLSDADGLRASEFKHPVQGLNGDGDLSATTSVGPRAQCIADHSFKPADGSLHQSPTRVPGLLLPADASMLGDALQMSIALGRSGLPILAQDCR